MGENNKIVTETNPRLSEELAICLYTPHSPVMAENDVVLPLSGTRHNLRHFV